MQENPKMTEEKYRIDEIKINRKIELNNEERR